MSPDYYQVLGCKYGCTAKEIKSAYRSLILKFHPDRNSDPNAAEITARLNEAYSVLGNERNRTLYDAWITGSQRSSETTTESDPRRRVETPQIKCAKCGRQDVTIRLVLLYYVVSLLLITYRKGASGLWCERCKIIEAAKWTCVSGIAGWWSFPWGPIYTIQSLFVNGKGGVQPRSENATILRVLGYQFYQKGKVSDAIVALRESLRLESNTEASQLLEFLSHGEDPKRGRSSLTAALSLVLTAVPSLVMLALLSCGIYLVASSPSGYQTSYEAPPALHVKSVAAPEIGPRARASNLVAQLAKVVESRAPVVGTHYEGTVLVQDHELDRARFDEGQLYPIADSIKTELSSSSPDSDGFLASAYFNAELFALSVDIINKMDKGRPIDIQVHRVLQLGTDPAVSRWLANSRFQVNYEALCRQLRSFSPRYHPGDTTEALSEEYRLRSSQLDSMKSRLTELKVSGDAESYNALVSEYNEKVELANALGRQGQLRTIATKKLDLGFNRCLDPATLMSEFQKVDLASHAAEIDSLQDVSTSSQ